MVTTEEIGAVELFAALDEAQREQLARVAADITLVAGEYAAPEGGERALFAVRMAHTRESGASRTRTGDLLGAIQALFQLSYSPVVRPDGSGAEGPRLGRRASALGE